MAEAPRLAAALQYQQGLDDITRPATVNPMMARQVAKSRELMTAPTSIMDERYPAWKKAQENADLFLLGADVAGLTPVAAKGAVAAAKFAAPKIAQGLEQHMVRSGMMLPIDVYHGTPHRFEPTAKNPLGEFSATKIGSGEGAQAYGYGHYFAENPNVAKDYQKTLSGKTDLGEQPSNSAFVHAIMSFKEAGYPVEQIPAEMKKAYKGITDKDIKLALQASNQGSLYKVDLPDEAVARMMDYDKHLSEQSPYVQKILSEYQKEIGTSFGRGDQVLKEIAFERRMKGLDDSPAAVAKQLSEMNIPGIQYLDAGSRGTSVGKGTRNFVVFPGNEGLLNILGRE
jgi:hypothetical protein